MMPIYDMMREAQNGEAMRQMGRRFGLNGDQVAQAFAALAPAFSTGLKRNVAGPQPLADFLAALSGGHHRRYFEDMQAAFSPEGVAEGNGILGHLFGSKDLSRQVAAQAAQATGIGQDILKQMLPVMASMIMGGLFKQAMGEAGTGGPAASVPPNPFGDMLREMTRHRSRPSPGSAQAPGKAPEPHEAFGRMMEAMFGHGGQQKGQAGKTAPGDPFADNPLARIFQDMMMAGVGRPEAPQPDPDIMPSGRRRNPYDDLFGPMFEAGREVQAGYQKSMESIFDQYLEGMKRAR